MRSIIESCRPRDGILQGTFNPEIFTASLSQVIAHYRGRRGQIDSLYTDPVPFFRDGTAPTEGISFVLRGAVAPVGRQLGAGHLSAAAGVGAG